MSKIELTDNIMSIIVKMSDGNPGAVSVLGKMLSSPEAFAADPLIRVLSLDTLQIYGADIWKFGEYVCKGQNMSLMNQILNNYSFGYLSKEVLKEHIRLDQPFERLYTEKEIDEDFTKRNLPIIEEELDDKLKALQKDEGAGGMDPAGFSWYEKDMPEDTYSEMKIETFIQKLEERGFVLGCEKPLTLDDFYGKKKEGSWRVYYQPEQGFVLPVTVCPGEELYCYGGKMVVQRLDTAEMGFDVCGDRSRIENYDGSEVYLYAKDIRENLFAWYDAIVETSTPCLEWITSDRSLDMGMAMITDEQDKWVDKCKEAVFGHSNTGLSFIYAPLKDICFLANMEQFSSGLMNIVHRVKEDLGYIITKELNYEVNFDMGNLKTRNSLDWLLKNLGKDDVWLKQNGVDLERAFMENQSYDLMFSLKENIPIETVPDLTRNTIFGQERVSEKEQVDEKLFELSKLVKRDIEEKLGCVFIPQNTIGSRDFGFIDSKTFLFKMNKINTDFSAEKMAAVLSDVLEKRGFPVKTARDLTIEDRKPSLSSMLSAALERLSSKSDDRQNEVDKKKECERV